MIAETCFFFVNDSNGRELGSSDIANADPTSMSHFPVTRGDNLRSVTQICFGTISWWSEPSLSVPSTTRPFPSFLSASLLIFEPSGSPLLRIVTFSIERLLLFVFETSMDPNLFETDCSDWLATNNFL